MVGTTSAPLLGHGSISHLLATSLTCVFTSFIGSKGRVVEIQTLWDIPEVMMQAGAWPMAPSLRREFCIPRPATNDGIVPGPWNEAQAQASCDHIVTMLKYMKNIPPKGPEVMEMPRFWSDRVNWYGPAGSEPGIAAFATGTRSLSSTGCRIGAMMITYHFFGDGDYAAVTGWPNMIQTVTHDGWMGIAPSGKRI